LLLAAVALTGLTPTTHAGDKTTIRVIIIDGQNNHNWVATTPVMKKELEDSGRFTVDVATSPPIPNAFASWTIDFDKYDVVVSNYNGQPWPKAINEGLEQRLKTGKIGLVIVHAANNAFGGWKEYNLMIGMGWRGANGGERLYLDEQGSPVKVPSGNGEGSGHRYSGVFNVTVRDESHPVTRGMPREWMHAGDELYDNMRGPIENVHMLATAYSKGTKVHEPMIWTVSYGKGRVFHTPMGHDANAMRCVGFAATLQRGTEWAATGAVTLALPENFPTDKKISTIK
jgi:type 1 glutamine amidotransferase